MANAGGFIYESIWRDDDFRSLSRTAQALYLQLLSQKELDCCGALPLQPQKWVKGCNGITLEQIMHDLNELQEHRFVFYDDDTFEAWIRTYMRNSNVLKVPNMRKSARRAANLVASPAIRAVLADELRATTDAECIATAYHIDPFSKQTPEPFRNPSVTLPEGSGVGEGKGVTNVSNNSSGVNRPKCSKHPAGNSETENCRGCMQIRLWDEQHAATLAADELETKRRARAIAASCPDCQGTNIVEISENTARKCNHPGVSNA
jgi:hypothetical protein